MRLSQTRRNKRASSRRDWERLLRVTWLRGKRNQEPVQTPETTPTTPIRTCGGCTACCKALEVHEGAFHKPIHRWCLHARMGSGCAIYAHRPGACAAFRCEWLKGWGNDNERPDKTRIVPDFHTQGLFSGGLLQLWEVSPGALAKLHTVRKTRESVLKGVPVVHIPVVGGRRIYLKAGTFLPQAVVDQLAAEKLTIIPVN